MTQYNKVTVKLPNSELNTLKPGIKNCTEVTLNLSANLIAGSNDWTDFSHKLLLTGRQVQRFYRAFANNSSAEIKLWKNQPPKIVLLEKFPGRLFGPLLKTGVPLMENVVKPLAKSDLIQSRLTAAASGQKGGFLSMLLGTLSASLLVNLLTGKEVKAKVPGGEKSKGAITAGQDF